MIRKIITLHSILMIFLAIELFYPCLVFPDIYKYTDEEGVIHLTNVPTEANAKYILILRERRERFNVNLKNNTQYDHLIAKASAKYNVDHDLIRAIIKAESNFNHRAVSRVGAKGLMQLMPATASLLKVQDSFHPETNIEGGVRYIRYLLDLFKGNLPLALAAYNAGEGAVIRYNQIPPYHETQEYVQKVMRYFNNYSNKN